MQKFWIIAGASLFMLVAAYLFAPDQAVVMFKELVAAFGPSPEGFGPLGGGGQ